MPKPLIHFQILDLSRILAGPFATQLLADLGADVLKIEAPFGDPTRDWGPPFENGDGGESAYFRCANRGKRSLVLDLGVPEHLARLRDLLKDADVLVENFPPDTAERLGLTWERLHDSFPKLILASIRGFASDVLASHRTGYDFVIQAESGLMSITGDPEGHPVKVGSAVTDVLASLFAANGIQAALLHRERTGEALHVEVPLMEAALASLVNVASGTLMTGQAPKRFGNSHPNLVPCQNFVCSNGDVVVAVDSDAQFEVLALWLGLDLESHPLWRDNHGRVADRDCLIKQLEQRFRSHTTDSVLDFCELHSIPAGRIRTVDDALFRQAGRLHHLIQTLYDETANCMVPVLASPILLNDERACSKRPPPRWNP